MVVKPGKRQAKAPRTASPLTSLITAPRRTAGAQLKPPGRRGRKPEKVTRFRRCAAMHFGDFPLSFLGRLSDETKPSLASTLSTRVKQSLAWLRRCEALLTLLSLSEITLLTLLLWCMWGGAIRTITRTNTYPYGTEASAVEDDSVGTVHANAHFGAFFERFPGHDSVEHCG